MENAEQAKSYFFSGLDALAEGRLEVAEVAFTESLRLVPDRTSVLTNLAAVQIRLLKYQAALCHAEKAISLDTKNFEGLLNAGVANYRLKRNHQAVDYFDKAIQIDGANADAWCNRGVSKKELGYFEEAESDFEMALSINPEHVEALTNLGNLLSLEGRYKEAEVRHRMAISLQPNHSEVCANLGRNLASQGRYEEAESYLERAISLQPNLASAYNNLGGVLGNMGKIPEAVENFEKAVQLDPEHYDAHSNILFGRNYLRDFSTDLYLDEARRYGSKVSERALPKFSSWNSRGEGKRIRVGFVSGDFKKHSVAYFLEGLIKHFDKERFELTAFPTSHKSDEVTHRIKPLFNEWVPIVGESDFDAARIIHERGINALIDLSGHTAFNRLPVLSFRPAPIQATWLGFFASTGLPEIDYFIGDPQMAPPGEEKHFTEQVWNLPETWLCFSPPQEVVEIQAPPAQKNGFITFGNFGNLSKVNDDVIAVWSRVMTEIPSSKLFLKAKQLGDKKISEKLVLKFRENGIDSNRLTLEGSSPREEYLRAYNDIDIVLDTFPYPGGTTSNEALWMSVPILTLRGDRFLSRLGFSINTNAGLTDWVANDVNEYVQKAVVLTSDLSRLANFRSRLRAKVLKTPLFDQARFARNFENMIKDMCDKHNI